MSNTLIKYHFRIAQISRRIKPALKEEDKFSKELLQRLLVDLSIWIPHNFYRRLPIILPYVIRDNSCRIKTKNREDEWGSANSHGFLRDDNSLLKGIVRSFPISSPKISQYQNKKIGTGFVASHIWGNINIDGKVMKSNQHFLFNSFVPNLVWLPTQLSKLTDREGSYAQLLMQAISYKLYKDITLPDEIESIWDTLTPPKNKYFENKDLGKINFFNVPDYWLTKRINNLISEIDLIISKDIDSMKKNKIKANRYLPTLKKVSKENRRELDEWLNNYKTWLRS